MHFRGSWKPENPPCTSMLVTCRQDLHCRCKRIAREDKVDAEMTIPGKRTRREMLEACVKSASDARLPVAQASLRYSRPARGTA